MPARGSNEVLNKIERDATAGVEAIVNSFEDRSPEIRGDPVELDEQELANFEQVVNEWLDQMHEQERKAKAVQWFAGMLGRLRAKIGMDESQVDQNSELDRIGMAVVSDCVVTLDGYSSVGVDRVAPRHSRIMFEGQESVRIIQTEELEARKDMLKVNTSIGEMAARELVFRDAVTGRKEVRRFALVDGDLKRIHAGHVVPQWLNWRENYVLKLIRAVLSEVSK